MAEENRENEKPIRAKRTMKRVLCAGVIVILLVLIGCFLWATNTLMSRSADKRLVEIEAARAIPDSENAAIVYSRLLKEYNESYSTPDFLTPTIHDITNSRPWSSKDYPELAKWVEERKDFIENLIQALEIEKCRFPIFIEPYRYTQVKRLILMRKWAYLLRRAANNDIAEGRTYDAIAKWQFLIQMGIHLRQQPTLLDYLVGIAIEAIGINQTITFLVECDTNESNLQKIESFPLQTLDDWTLVLDRIRPVEKLASKKYKKQMSLLERLKYAFGFGPFAGRKDPYPIVRDKHLRMLASNRGIHILVALRRYRNKHGRWPTSLDEIKSQVPAEILVDPLNKGSFVYKLTDDCFILYSKGKNNIDEAGQYKKDGADDWPIWPTRK